MAYELTSFNGVPQYKLSKMNHIPDADRTPWMIQIDESNYNKLVDYISCIKDAELNASLYELVIGNKQEFILASGAIAMHHNYAGGLVDHTLEVLEFALNMAPNEPGINNDVIIASAIIHDWGKINAYSISDLGVVGKYENYFYASSFFSLCNMYFNNYINNWMFNNGLC